MRILRHARVSVLGLIVALLAGIPAFHFHAAARSSPQLPGSWIVNVAPTPSSAVPPFTSLASMTLDGRLVNVHPEVGISLGEWERLPTGAYAVTFVGLIPQDNALLTSKVRATIDVDSTGGLFTGLFQTDITDGDGNVVLSFAGTVSGIRFRVQPL